jgi:hypothetical protein
LILRHILSYLLILFFVSPVFAAAVDSLTFSNEDLEKYRHSSSRFSASPDSNPSSDSNKPGTTEGIRKDGQERLRKYEVKYQPQVGNAKRIIIPVTFNGSLTAPMALDTGATGMHMTYSLAEKLGIFMKNEGRLLWAAGGIGGTVPAIITVIDTVSVEEAGDNFVPTTITDSAFNGFNGLIGMDFMAKYSIQIDTKRHVVVFEELPPRPEMPGGHDEEWWRSNFHEFASMRAAWKKYRDYLYSMKDFSLDVTRLRGLADRQCNEANKLLNKLNGYAIDHVVPMQWREY